eukprot:5714575-Ditylum_brightwellii.AAC.1
MTGSLNPRIINYNGMVHSDKESEFIVEKTIKGRKSVRQLLLKQCRPDPFYLLSNCEATIILQETAFIKCHTSGYLYTHGGTEKGGNKVAAFAAKHPTKSAITVRKRKRIKK